MQFVALKEIARQYGERTEISRLRHQFGGKGLNLGILVHGHFPVPDGFVIPTDIFIEYINNIIKKYPSDTVQDCISKLEFDSEFIQALESAMAAVPVQKWAVRSSSTDEDSQTHSFAGLQQSVIGVDSIQSCLEAIRTVWKSFFARERLLYPIQNNLSAPVPAMAVIVQAYVDSETAGVVFSQHPMEGKGTVLINVSHGQGANVVDGKAAESLTLSTSDIDKDCASECLTTRQIRHLIQTAEKIETCFGRPQDIEFAFENNRLNILQARDIAENLHIDDRTLYSNVNVGEALSGVATPMTWSVGMYIAQMGFDCIFASFGLKFPKNYTFVTTFNGHIYINISQFLSVANQIPFIQPALLGKIAGIKALGDFAFNIEHLSRKHFLLNLPKSIAELVKIQSNISKLPQKAETFEKERDALFNINLKSASSTEIQSTFNRLNDLFWSCSFDMLSAAGAFLASYIVCSQFIDHFDETESNELEQYMFSGLLDVQCAAPGLALLDMASVIHNYPDLTAAFIEEESFQNMDDFINRIRPLEGFDEFETLLQRFMQLYGARANQEAELATPRWRENPRFLFRVIRAHLKSGIQTDAKNIVNSVSSDREKHTDDFHSTLSAVMRPVFKKLLEMTQKNSRLREKWRSYVVDVLGLFRKFFLEVAEQWTRKGILLSPDDIFFLTYDEFLAGIHEPPVHAPFWVAFRKARHEACLSACVLPDTFVTHPNQCSEPAEIAGSRVLYGIPASPGCVRAKVRVARTLEEAADLEYGEILVAPSTDVGWTPLFLVASAILTERGGPLSHAFVVAREYGIPAVVSVPGLLSCLKTGDIVRISGRLGTIEF
ncbi:MAG: hypothetical protein IJU23_11360 [Proteobacteria bacterium]|nr:hypothetical protein [Pseudomonadota bacterium]